jgi:hypothetical protein
MARKAVTLSFPNDIYRSFKLLVIAKGVHLTLYLLIILRFAKPTHLSAGLSQLKGLFEVSPMSLRLVILLMVRVSPAALARAVVMITIGIMNYRIHSFKLEHGVTDDDGFGDICEGVGGGCGC